MSSDDSVLVVTHVEDSEEIRVSVDDTLLDDWVWDNSDALVGGTVLVVGFDVVDVVSSLGDNWGFIGLKPDSVPLVVDSSDDLDLVSALSVDLDVILVLVEKSSLDGWLVSDVETEVFPSSVVEPGVEVETSSAVDDWVDGRSDLGGMPLVVDSSLKNVVVVSVVGESDGVLVSVHKSSLSLWRASGCHGVDSSFLEETLSAVMEVESELSSSC